MVYINLTSMFHNAQIADLMKSIFCCIAVQLLCQLHTRKLRRFSIWIQQPIFEGGRCPGSCPTFVLVTSLGFMFFTDQLLCFFPILLVDLPCTSISFQGPHRIKSLSRLPFFIIYTFSVWARCTS